MSEFVSGPWLAHPWGRADDDERWRIIQLGQSGGAAGFAVIHPRGRSPETVAATARLIAAAPELLEALQNLSIVMRELHDHWDNDRDMKVGKCLLALSGLLPGYDKRIDVIHAAIAKATGGEA